MLTATVLNRTAEIIAEISADDEISLYEELVYFSYIMEDEYEEYVCDDCWRVIIEDEYGNETRIYPPENNENEDE